MKIYFERSGGFAGMLSSTTVDTQNLSSKEANEIKNLVEKAHFFELPSKLSQNIKGAADYFVYKITIQNNNNNNNNQSQHSVECNDVNIQPTLRPLIDILTKYLRK
jgi:hypothetical protein